MLENKNVCIYEPEKDFYRLLNETDKIPFRDKESYNLIQMIDYAKFVKNDRYSIETPLGRTCLSALSSDAKYALTVLANSRKGI